MIVNVLLVRYPYLRILIPFVLRLISTPCPGIQRGKDDQFARIWQQSFITKNEATGTQKKIDDAKKTSSLLRRWQKDVF